MLKLYLMASNGYLPTLVFRPEQGFNRVPKDSQRLLPNYDLWNDVIRSSPLNMATRQNVGSCNNDHLDLIDPTISKPALINIQGSTHQSLHCCPNSMLLSFKFPVSGLIQVEKDGLDLLSLSDLTGLQSVTTDNSPYFPDTGQMNSQLVYPNPELDSRRPVIDFVGDLIWHSQIRIHEDGQVSLIGTRTEMKDILSILAEFYISRSSTNRRKSLVPQFNRLDYESAFELETVIIAPPKSPEKMKKSSPKKKKGARNKTIFKDRSNYIQACESLISIVVDKSPTRKSAIPVLKKSGSELPNLLTQFSASIAGTGLAVLFSVMCKVASGTVPFCSSKVLNTGLGLGLVWLSWAVNRLRDTIVMINKNSNKREGLKDEEMMRKLDRSVKEIYFRAATLMAVMVLRFA